MKKSKLLLTLALAACSLGVVGVNAKVEKVCAETNNKSFTVTFKSNTSDGSEITSASSLIEQITSGTEYVKGCSNISKVYSGKSGLKMGSGSAIGKVTIKLDKKYTISSIDVITTAYNSKDGGKLVVNGNILNAFGTDSTYTYATATETDEITFATSAKRGYLTSFTVNYVDGTSNVGDEEKQNDDDNQDEELTAPEVAKVYTNLAFDYTANDLGDGLIEYTDFSNLTIQYTYAYDATKNPNTEETGLILTKDDETALALADEITELPASKIQKFVNSNKQETYTISVNNIPLEKEAITTYIYAISYAKLSNGKYYFTKDYAEYTLQNIVNIYETDTTVRADLSDEAKDIVHELYLAVTDIVEAD